MTVKLAHQPPPEACAHRHACEVETTCQPPSAWAKDPWPATILAIWPGGLSLALGRRFEKGAGLAVELPADDGTTSTVLARITQARPHDGGWLLDVAFISELGEDEVRQVLHQSDTRRLAPPSVSGVLFQARRPDGSLLRWFVRRLDLAGQWPLPAGKTLVFRMPKLPPVTLAIRRCRSCASCWVIDCAVPDGLPAEVLDALERPAERHT
jgi:hypothetical protein